MFHKLLIRLIKRPDALRKGEKIHRSLGVSRDYLGETLGEAEPMQLDAGAVDALATAPLSRALWADAQVQTLATASAQTAFVRALAHGTLQRGAFAGYVAQDKFFLDAFASAYADLATKVRA